ncbi:MAG: hypothetical protein INR70_40395 [Parafilimonas terrae]|nr:hypothetical protein [Parafilimonas terrae]
MSSKALILGAVTLIALAGPVMAAKPMKDKDRLRAEAEHLCYDDVMKLCPDNTDDDEKTKGCMKSKRAELSPDCRKVFDKGMGM